MAEQTVQVGERLAVSYDITNRGQSDGEQTVELTLDGEVADSEALVLDTGEKDRMSLVTDAFTDEDDGEIYGVEIVTDDRVAQVMTVEVIAIPDGLVLDDFANDPTITSTSITDRKDFGELEYSFDPPESDFSTESRPEWIISAGDSNVSVENGRLTLSGDPNPTLSFQHGENARNFEWTIQINNSDTSAEFWTHRESSGDRDDGYRVRADTNENEFTLEKAEGGSFSVIISESGVPQDEDITMRAEVDDEGNWELFVNEDSVGTDTDDTHINADYSGIDSGRSGAEWECSRYEIY